MLHIVNTMKRNLRRKNKAQKNVHEWKNRQNDDCNPMLFLSVQRIHMSTKSVLLFIQPDTNTQKGRERARANE